ncbi:MAG: inositol monophosphatase family protein [Alphaproteobacteria bacterium]
MAAALTHTARSAGELILRYRARGHEVTYKADGSPVTYADRAAEELILNDVGRLMPDAVVIGEESASVVLSSFSPDEPFFLVDPVDGTRAFVNNSDDFSVNIGYIVNRKPVFGLIYAPALQKLYVTLAPDEAVFVELRPERGTNLEELKHTPLQTRKAGASLKAITSRSHMSDETNKYMARLPIEETQRMSSALKFAVVAEGNADVYPRLAPTSEWDTAAGQAVLAAAGGCTLAEGGSLLSYGKVSSELVNSGFIAWGDPSKPLDLGVAKV